MTPFLDLFFFYKTRYWKYLLRTRPVIFVLSRAIKLSLFLLVLTQMGFAYTVEKAGLEGFRQLSMEKLIMTALVLNVAGNLYFPAKYHQDIKKGRYYLFPVSAYTLNNLRIVESLSSISFLSSVNLLVLPAFSQSLVYGCFLPVSALCLCLVSQFISDLIMVILGKFWIFFLVLVLGGIALTGTADKVLAGVLGVLESATPGTGIIALVALSGIVYFIDTQLLRLSSIKNVPHE